MFVRSAKVFPTNNNRCDQSSVEFRCTHKHTLYAHALTHSSPIFFMLWQKLFPMANSLDLCDYDAKIIAGNERWSKAIYVCVSKLIDYKWAHATHTGTHTRQQKYVLKTFAAAAALLQFPKYYGAHTITFDSNWLPLVYYCYQYVWDCCQLDWMCTCKWANEWAWECVCLCTQICLSALARLGSFSLFQKHLSMKFSIFVRDYSQPSEWVFFENGLIKI